MACGDDCGCIACARSRGLVTRADFSIVAADTEYSFAMPSNALSYALTNKSNARLRFSFVAGTVADPTATQEDNFTLLPMQEDMDMGETAFAGSDTLYYASSLRGAKFAIDFVLGSI